MRWLITGSSGFIGTHFLRLLEGEEVVELNAHTRLGPIRSESHVGDVTDQALIDTIVGRLLPDVIVHFAAESSVTESYARPKSFVRTNIEGPVCLLEAVRRLSPKTRLVHVSTDEVYGDRTDLAGSNSPLDPQNPYAASKAAAEHFIHAYRRAYHLNVTIVRPSNNWGEGQQLPKFIPAALEAKRTGNPMVVHSLEVARDFLYVGDNVQAIHELALYPIGGVWNIATGYLSTLGEVLERIGDVPYTVAKERPDADRAYHVDASVTWKTLEWAAVPLHSDLRFEEYIR